MTRKQSFEKINKIKGYETVTMRYISCYLRIYQTNILYIGNKKANWRIRYKNLKEIINCIFCDFITDVHPTDK